MEWNGMDPRQNSEQSISLHILKKQNKKKKPKK